jgi:mannose-6-phosphate isomerase
MSELLQLLPIYQPRVWGGRRLKPDADQPIGEAWVIYEHNQIARGCYAGRTLGALAAEQGAELLGEAALARTGTRFPLLIKLLDCQDWLSVQVHPNDAHAVALEGPGHFGKTEAWHVLEAAPGARLLAGVRQNISAEALAQAIQRGQLLDVLQEWSVQAGDTIFIPAGTLHALGPGLLIYEVQQTSDLTYRVWDWGRPASAGRPLHIQQAMTVADPEARSAPQPLRPMLDTDAQRLVTCPYFTFNLLASHTETLALDTEGQSFHALTVAQGAAIVEYLDQAVQLNQYDSLVVPAACRNYQIRPLRPIRVLQASVV